MRSKLLETATTVVVNVSLHSDIFFITSTGLILSSNVSTKTFLFRGVFV